MVDFVLRPEPGVEKKVLDIGWSACLLSLISLTHISLVLKLSGCGSGIWQVSLPGIFECMFIFLRTVATANRYPHVEVIGTDLAPAIMNENGGPVNCRFELDDVNRGLAHFYDQMDLVHMRAVSAGVSDHCLLPIPQALFYPSLVTLSFVLSNSTLS